MWSRLVVLYYAVATQSVISAWSGPNMSTVYTLGGMPRLSIISSQNKHLSKLRIPSSPLSIVNGGTIEVLPHWLFPSTVVTDPAFSLEVKKAASVGMHLYAVVFTLEGGGGSNNASVRFQSQEPCLPDVVLFFYYERTTTTPTYTTPPPDVVLFYYYERTTTTFTYTTPSPATMEEQPTGSPSRLCAANQLKNADVREYTHQWMTLRCAF